MSLHKQPATQTDQNTNNVRNDHNSDNAFVAMPSIPQQDPSDNAIKPRRRERVADPARDLVRRQRAVEAARPGHLVYLLVDRGGVRAPAALIRHSVLHAKWCSGAGCQCELLRCGFVFLESSEAARSRSWLLMRDLRARQDTKAFSSVLQSASST